ncbi:MAG: hypothetical protein FWG31_06570 [Oscillospiraceae bacterium]|nr:hypothetical protein [Oscillospiraceae bacterium]
MYDIIEEIYADKAIRYDNMWFYFIDTAKDVVADCKKHNIKIRGFEALKLTGAGIQPSMEHSMDFNPNEGNWEKADEFLSKIKDTTYLYDIMYEI